MNASEFIILLILMSFSVSELKLLFYHWQIFHKKYFVNLLLNYIRGFHISFNRTNSQNNKNWYRFYIFMLFSNYYCTVNEHQQNHNSNFDKRYDRHILANYVNIYFNKWHMYKMLI